MIIAIHTAFGFAALIAGAWNVLRPKGTLPHRRRGWIYAGAMYGLIFSSFFIFEMFGGFGVFHIMSVISGATLTVALYFPLRRHRYPHWIEHHYFWITYSYVGLLMATGSHFFEYLPGWPYPLRAGLFWGLPLILGTLGIFGSRKRVLDSIIARRRTSHHHDAA